MDAVVGVRGVEGAAVGGEHGGEVINPFDMVLLRVGFEAGVQGIDLLGGVSDFLAPGESGGGEDRAENRANLVRFGELDHGDDVAEGIILVIFALVEGDVVAAAEDDDGLGLEVYDIAPETQNHLGGDFAADAALDHLVVVEETGSSFRAPALGDGVADKNDTAFSPGRDGRILPVEPVIMNEILCRKAAYRKDSDRNSDY